MHLAKKSHTAHVDNRPIVFRYVPERYEGAIIFRPKVEVRLKNRGYIFRIAMLVASGADISFIPLEIAEILEVELKDNPKPSRSASGTFRTKRGILEAELLKGDEAISLGTLHIFVPAERLEDDEYMMSYALLGRDPFFDKFDVLFRQKSRKLILYPRQKLKTSPLR